MGETGETMPNLGCFAALTQNDAHERQWAKRQEGGVRSKGYVYTGPEDAASTGSSL